MFGTCLGGGNSAEPAEHGAHSHAGAPDLGGVELCRELVDDGEAGGGAELAEEHEEGAEVALGDEAGGDAEDAEEGHGEHHQGLPAQPVHRQGADDARWHLCSGFISKEKGRENLTSLHNLRDCRVQCIGRTAFVLSC